jgi:rod shape-determining protein MreC
VSLFISRATKIIISILICVVCLGFVGFYTENNYLTDFVSLSLSPLQKLGTTFSDNIKSVIPSSKTDEDYQKIIKTQQEELQKMRSIVIDYETLKQQNEQYEKYYEFKKQNESLKFVLASVIGKDPDENFYGFSIDKGSLSGICVNDPVITPNGLVGWIYSVRPMSSLVKTILSQDSKVSVFCKEKNESGIIIGDVKLADENLTAITFLNTKSNFSEGDMLITSGLSGLFPRDLPVGRIKSAIESDQKDGVPFCKVEPFEDIKNITDVSVVNDFENKGKIKK